MIRERLSDISNNLVLYLGKPRLLRMASIKPTFAVLRVTENCNGRCITCNAWRYGCKNELGISEIRGVLQDLKTLGINTIRLSGGEPLIRPDIGDIISECNNLGFREIYLGTNGLLLMKKAKEVIESGANHIGVSIDGIGETNDRIRGISSIFKSAVEGIETVNELKREKGTIWPAVSIFTTFLKQNIDQMPQLIEMCEGLRARWCFNLLDANWHFFEGIDMQRLVVRDHRKIDEIIDYLKRVRKVTPHLVYLCDHMLEYARTYLKRCASDMNPSMPPDVPCVLGYGAIIVRSQGQVDCGCSILGSLGNIRERSLLDIVRSEECREKAERMYRRECPGCTFLCAVNGVMRHMISHSLLCRIPSWEEVMRAFEKTDFH